MKHCAHCHKPVAAPDVYWHPWFGYLHRSCWGAFVEAQ